MSEETSTGPGTRAAAVALIQAAAKEAAELDKATSTDAEAAAGLTVIDHVVNVASVHALLAAEARLGEIATRLGELVEARAPRHVEVGSIRIPPGTTREQIDQAFARAEAFTRARMTGKTPASGR